LVRSVKHILVIGAGFALLSVYIYFHASTDTFVIYLIALTLWTGLSGYCALIRGKRSQNIFKA
jgi:hypothetical protein